MKDEIKLGKRYFLRMRPIEHIPAIDFTYTTLFGREKWVECEVVENKSKSSSKVTLRSTEDGYGQEEFYRTDFDSLVNEGSIVEKTNDSQHVEEVTWREPLTPAVCVEHSAYVVI